MIRCHRFDTRKLYESNFCYASTFLFQDIGEELDLENRLDKRNNTNRCPKRSDETNINADDAYRRPDTTKLVNHKDVMKTNQTTRVTTDPTLYKNDHQARKEPAEDQEDYNNADECHLHGKSYCNRNLLHRGSKFV